ncbi:hypothetical protein BDV96DRAFT_595409 [Lophiotrema nucula]|uniref:Rhodopsin domain-containing protein n=1 Tax=Lophiotrema nucula TaxID=690887 RepID=A0A6A5ZP73_9PLEO|nr:hypothetical protein BDV96DRAFT_595409 [Lophiotrema nucula]
MSTGYTSPESMIAVSVLLPALAVVAIFTIAMGVVTIIGVHGHGVGYASPPLLVAGGLRTSRAPELTISAKVDWINLWLQPLALGCIKLSVLAFYTRIFTVHKSGILYHLIIILNGLTVVWMVAFFFAHLFKCKTSFSRLWGVYNDLAGCANGHALHIDEAFAISDFCFDVLLLVLPLPRVWSLRLSLKRRLLVSLVFLIGALAVVGSILRMVGFIQIQIAIESGNVSVDGLILVTKFLFWSIFEVGLAIIAVCLPTLNAHLRKMDASSIIRSVRSVISLHSLRSRHTRSHDQACDPSVPEEYTSVPPGLNMSHLSVSVKKSEDNGAETYTTHKLQDMP